VQPLQRVAAARAVWHLQALHLRLRCSSAVWAIRPCVTSSAVATGVFKRRHGRERSHRVYDRFLEALIGCTSSNASSGRNTGTWGCCTNNESATAQPNTTHYGSVLAAGSKDGHCR
ncbi:hypothetical protein PR002_g26970, partial [Phytophthora rubi]